MRVLLIGPPGAGKGTQATRIAEHFDLGNIATGALLREQVANETELGKVAKEYMDRGDLVPDDIVIEMARTGWPRPPRRAGTCWTATPHPGPGRGRLPVGGGQGDPVRPDPVLRDRGGGAAGLGWPGGPGRSTAPTTPRRRSATASRCSRPRPSRWSSTTTAAGSWSASTPSARSTPSASRSSQPPPAQGQGHGRRGQPPRVGHRLR